ncbi:MAG TPA: ribosome maturation factor RimP [Pilimelia sp.]|nr:ribosome maturation factor RimP [Pilimelia sp.]
MGAHERAGGRRPGAAARPRAGAGRTGPRQSPAPPGGDAASRRERLRAVVEPVVTGAGYDLEDVTVSRVGRRHLVRVVVDGDGGVGLDDIAVVARAVSAALDAAEANAGELVAGEYQLEVGSPGVDRPLTLPRHWRRNVGRLVSVRAGERALTGRVLAADDEGVVLDVAGGAVELAHADLGPGRVQVEFARLDEVSDDDLEEIPDPTAADDAGERGVDGPDGDGPDGAAAARHADGRGDDDELEDEQR